MQVLSFDSLLGRVCIELHILDIMYFTFDGII